MAQASLKRRLILVTLTTVLVTWLLSGALLLTMYRRVLYQQVDRTLIARAAALQAHVRFEPPHKLKPRPRRRGDARNDRDDNQPPPPPNDDPDDGYRPESNDRRRRDDPENRRNRPKPKLEFDTAAAMLVDRNDADGMTQYQIRVHENGRILAASAMFKTLAIAVDPVKAVTSHFNMALPDGRMARAAASRVVIRTDGPPNRPTWETEVVIVVACPIQKIDHDVARLGQIVTAAGMIGIGLVILAILLSIRFGLHPVGAITRQIGGIGGHNLSKRVDAKRMPAELQPLAQHVNALLERLEDAFEREHSFIANAAHELRTPLAAIQTSTEIALRQQREPEAYEQVLERNMRVLSGMHGLVEKLLLLARLENQQAALRVEEVPLSNVVQTIWDEAQLAVGRDDVTCDFDLPPELTVPADVDLLCVVLTNLMRNAAQYVNEGGQVRLDAEADGKGWRVMVANSGCDLDDEQIERVFDRFWQADRSRTRIGENAGLGLSIARRAAELLGGELRAERFAGEWFRMTLEVRDEKQPTRDGLTM